MLEFVENAGYVLPGIDPTHIQQIYPVIVTLGPLPEGDLAWHEYERALNDHQLLVSANLGKNIARLQLLTAEDVELLPDLVREGGN